MLVVIFMLIAYMLSSMVIGQTDTNMTPEEISQAGRAIIFVAGANALILSILILRSPLFGLKLIGAVFLVHFGVETFMAQIETVYFNKAIQMAFAEFVSIVAAGGLRALLFAPFAVFILGKMTKSVRAEEKPTTLISEDWYKLLLPLSLLYVVVYFTFGYYVAWQWEETRLFYSGTTAIKPFYAHFWDLFLMEDPLILPFQLLRGVLWTILAIIIVRMIRANRWQVALVVGLAFAVLLSLPLGLFPNPYMPLMVTRSHFFEISFSVRSFKSTSSSWYPTTPSSNPQSSPTFPV